MQVELEAHRQGKDDGEGDGHGHGFRAVGGRGRARVRARKREGRESRVGGRIGAGEGLRTSSFQLTRCALSGVGTLSVHVLSRPWRTGGRA